ncbi:ATP-binding cassette domain-containing protein [Bradyrhizobium amphicarpaeae]|nr:ATP-binding cassette domain-containing protein [Bradyrhizobium amphicarpaeae]
MPQIEALRCSMNAILATIERRSLSDHFPSAIEGCVAEAEYTDALNHLQDYADSFWPPAKRDILLLRGRFNRWRSAQRQGVTNTENINDIGSAILDAAEDIRANSQNPQRSGSGGLPKHHAAAKLTQPDDLDRRADQPTVAEAPNLEKAQKLHWRLYNETKGTPVCRLDLTTKSFGQGAFELQPVSLQLHKGQITAVVGRNASGKTTFLQLCAGSLHPDSGRVTFPGLSDEGDGWRQLRSKIAIVPQLPTKWHGPLRQNLNYIASVHCSRKSSAQEDVDWYLNRYDLQDYEACTWDQLSGGYRMRFELVRALLSKPKLVLLDEPLAYLDIVARRRFLQDLSSIARSLEKPLAVLITSQHLLEVEIIADQIVVFDDGACKYNGPVEGLKSVIKYRVIHVTIDAQPNEVKQATVGLPAKSIERTIEGYIFTFPLETHGASIAMQLYREFGDRLKAVRDLTESTEAYIGSESRDIWQAQSTAH